MGSYCSFDEKHFDRVLLGKVFVCTFLLCLHGSVPLYDKFSHEFAHIEDTTFAEIIKELFTKFDANLMLFLLEFGAVAFNIK